MEKIHNLKLTLIKTLTKQFKKETFGDTTQLNLALIETLFSLKQTLIRTLCRIKPASMRKLWNLIGHL